MQQNISCPICRVEMNSELGKGCKMCGMPLDDEGKDFCSKKCRSLFKKINLI